MFVNGLNQHDILELYMDLIGVNVHMVAHNLDCGIETTKRYVNGSEVMPEKIHWKCIMQIYSNPNKALKKELLKKYNTYS